MGHNGTKIATMKYDYGIQQLQLGKICKSEHDVQRALLTLSEAGYRSIELNGFMIRKTPFIAKLLLSLSGMGIKKSQRLNWQSLTRDCNFKVISIHEDIDTLENNFEEVEKEISIYGPLYIVITGLYQFAYDDEGELGKLIVRLNRIGRELSALGVGLLYHNHSVEFQNVDETAKAYDILIDGLNPEWVNFEFDSYWCVEAGADPIYWMKRLGSRLKLYHICDRGSRAKGPYMTPILKTDAMELGFGSMNLNEYVKLATELGVNEIILEQHRNYFGGDPVASAQKSAGFFRKMLEE